MAGSIDLSITERSANAQAERESREAECMCVGLIWCLLSGSERTC